MKQLLLTELVNRRCQLSMKDINVC